jgi:hypothetical protein
MRSASPSPHREVILVELRDRLEPSVGLGEATRVLARRDLVKDQDSLLRFVDTGSWHARPTGEGAWSTANGLQ